MTTLHQPATWTLHQDREGHLAVVQESRLGDLTLPASFYSPQYSQNLHNFIQRKQSRQKN